MKYHRKTRKRLKKAKHVAENVKRLQKCGKMRKNITEVAGDLFMSENIKKCRGESGNIKMYKRSKNVSEDSSNV